MNKKEYTIPEIDVLEFTLQDGIAATRSIGDPEQPVTPDPDAPELPDDDL